MTQGGWRFGVLSAGYLGSLLFGALFLLLGGKRRRAPGVIGLIGLFTLGPARRRLPASRGSLPSSGESCGS